MWAAILPLIGTILQFLLKWGLNWLDHKEERRKERKKIHDEEIKTAPDQRSLLMAINKYNRVR